MRTLLLSLLIFLIPGTIIAQHYHFIYVQGENQQTFYIKKSGELISSSATGFVIIPKLPAGTHQMTIGFPKNQWPEYEFMVEIKSSDRGFTLKKIEDKGWALFDLQTSELITGKKIDPPKTRALPENPKTDDPFAVILASAVGDEGIRETALVAMKFDKPEPVATKTSTPPPAVQKTESKPAESPKLPVLEEPKNVAIVKQDDPKPAATKKTDDSSLTAVVNQETKSPDTKTVTPPPVVKNDDTAKKEVVKAAPVFESEPFLDPKTKDSTVSKNTNPPKNTYSLTSRIRKISEIRTKKTTELIFIDVTGSSADTVTVIIDDLNIEEPKPAAIKAPEPLPNRTDCKEMATEKDMLALRKKVLRQNSEAEMLSHTMKDIKSRCYTVDMLQSTSYVFVSDKMRYQLFEESFPFVFDPSNYAKLERLLTTEEYITRFRELIKTK